jgi:glucosyl-dolichyl phosphate glucuronosyltransferase
MFVRDPDITIIIPTSNRAASLKRFLRSLDSLVTPESFQIEAVVVNNDSADETNTLLIREKRRIRPFAFEVLEETRRGKANAVNRGLEFSHGNIILIFDDDILLHPQCLIGHIECHRASEFDAVQGRVLPGLDPDGNLANPKRLREYNIPIVDYGENERPISGLIGTNISFKRKVFEKVGFLDARLGPGAAGFSEDTEYSQRIRKAGFTIGYTPLAIVYHELDPLRYGRVYNLRVAYRKGKSRSLYRQDSLVLHTVPNLLANCLRYVVYVVLGKSEKVYKTEGRIIKFFGYLVGRMRLLASLICKLIVIGTFDNATLFL